MLTANSTATVHQLDDYRKTYDAPPPPAPTRAGKKFNLADMVKAYRGWLLAKKPPSGSFRLLYVISEQLTDESPFEVEWAQKDIATAAGRQESTVWEMMPKLASLGVIEVDPGGPGSRNRGLYRLPKEFLDLFFGSEKTPAGRGLKHRSASVLEHQISTPKKPRRAGDNTRARGSYRK